jgi:hypothetical protein
MRAIVLLTILAMAGSAAAQQADPAATASSRPSAVADDDVGVAPAKRRFDPLKMLCRRVRPKTGTRISRAPSDERICLTAAEWERREEVARDVLETRDRGTCGPGGCNLPGQ